MKKISVEYQIDSDLERDINELFRQSNEFSEKSGFEKQSFDDFFRGMMTLGSKYDIQNKMETQQTLIDNTLNKTNDVINIEFYESPEVNNDILNLIKNFFAHSETFRYVVFEQNVVTISDDTSCVTYWQDKNGEILNDAQYPVQKEIVDLKIQYLDRQGIPIFVVGQNLIWPIESDGVVSDAEKEHIEKDKAKQYVYEQENSEVQAAVKNNPSDYGITGF